MRVINDKAHSLLPLVLIHATLPKIPTGTVIKIICSREGTACIKRYKSHGHPAGLMVLPQFLH
jgi:hypothetical protein